MKKYLPAFILFFFVLVTLHAQKHNIDSLKAALANAKHDTDKINALLHLSSALESTNPDSSILFGKQALSMSRNLSWQKGIANAHYSMGIDCDIKGEIQNGIAHEDSAMSICLKYNFKTRLAATYNELGNLISEQSLYPQALSYYFKALSLDSLVDKGSLADAFNNIGLVYAEQGNYVDAEEFYYTALKLYDAHGDKSGAASIWSNLGNIYDEQGDYEKALKNYFHSLKIDLLSGNKNYIMLDYSNIGNGYMSLYDYTQAFNYILKAIQLGKELKSTENFPGDYGNMGLVFFQLYKTDSLQKGFTYKTGSTEFFISHNNLLDTALAYEQSALSYALAANKRKSQSDNYKSIGEIYFIQKKYDKAIASFTRALEIADSTGVLREKMETAHALARALMETGNYRQAAQYLERVSALKDSLFGQEKEKALGRQEAQFDYDKKLLEQKKEREKEQALAAEKDKRQKFMIAGISTGLLIVLVFMFLLFKRFKITNEQKLVIEKQKKEVDSAYGELNNAHIQLQEKDKDITDSIAYARKIQSAILTSEEYLQQALGEHFVVYKPRDVVSGDFYWCYSEGNKTIFAVVDCTGHGVPGAFMSMIGNSLLNQVVIENHVTDAAKILDVMRSNLLKQLQQKGQETASRDGMDMAICVWDKKTGTLQFAGANNPLYIIRKGINATFSADGKLRPHDTDLLEILPDKQPIGYQEGKMDLAFTSYTIQLKKGDYVYIASDGYQDQFGGEKNKKFTSRAFRNMLISLNSNPMHEQKNMLEAAIEKWKDGYAQIDDICIIGVHII